MSDNWQTDINRIDGFLESDIRICLENNEDTYIERFRNLPGRKFNFCAAIFGSRWYAYRLMLKEGWLFWIIEMGASAFISTLLTVMGFRTMMDPDSIRTMIMVGGALVFLIFFFIQGFIADQIYWKRMRRELGAIGRQNSKEPAMEDEIEKMKGQLGVSIKSVIICSILWGIGNQLILKCIIYPIIYWAVGL